MHLGAATATVRHTWQRHGKPEPLLLMGFAAELYITFEEPADKTSPATRAERYADTPELNLGAVTETVKHTWQVQIPQQDHCCSCAEQNSFVSPTATSLGSITLQ
jgi:hypothetical protein